MSTQPDAQSTVEPLVVTGTVVTYDDEQPVVRDGAVYLGEDGRIDAVQPRRRRAPAGFERARRVGTGGVVTPGLIDLHNHLAYNTLPLWSAPRDTPYTSRQQWPGAATYGRDVSNPAQALGIAAAAATLRFAEVRAAAGGVTAIQGSPPVTRYFPGWMVRNIEQEQIPAYGKQQLVFQAVIKADVEALRQYAPRLQAGRSFVYHLAEGTAPALVDEYADLRAAGCVHPNLIGIHATALSAPQFADWAEHGAGTIVWSPFSNIWLYGETTDVLAARRHGLLVGLGSDWGPSGTKNLLGELKVAALWNHESLAGALDARDLGMMATANAGDALRRCWGVDIGRLRAGALADVLVTTSRVGPHADPHENLLRVDERAVRLVIVGGRPVLGTPALLAAAGATHVERLDVGGVAKGVVMRLPDEVVPPDPVLRAEADASWADGLAALRRVATDPADAVRSAKAAREVRPRGAPIPLEFTPDMPGPDHSPGGRALTDDELDQLVVPSPPSLTHDAAWFAAVDRGKPHAALLRQLRRRWRS
jgi:5-methylthioadenosine/S-adenosylhomocysteine deaminase